MKVILIAIVMLKNLEKKLKRLKSWNMTKFKKTVKNNTKITLLSFSYPVTREFLNQLLLVFIKTPIFY